MDAAARKYGLEYGFDAEAWTAISLASYYTALAFWFQSDTYCGGRWISNSRVEINHPYTRHEAIAPPKGINVLRVSHMEPGEWDFVWYARLWDRGWRKIRDDGPNVAVAAAPDRRP